MSLKDGMFSSEYYLNPVNFILTWNAYAKKHSIFLRKIVIQKKIKRHCDSVGYRILYKNDKVAFLDSEINMSCINYVEQFTDVWILYPQNQIHRDPICYL